VSRLQLALNVTSLDEAVGFYSALFGAEPAKVRPGYANFALEQPPLKLVLIESPGHGGTLNHLGIEVADASAVSAERTRMAAAGLAAAAEHTTTCCYAEQDKFWLTDTPDGAQWEIYTVLADSPVYGCDDTGEAACTAAGAATGQVGCC
jgi:catechol 2,3-dioxygenase-like lactoylglutathione lyase family enzyme